MASITGASRIGSLDDGHGNRPDMVLIVTSLALSAFGLLMIYSATRYSLERSNLLPSDTMERQLIFVTAGVILLSVLSMIDYREYRNYLPIIYAVMVVALATVFPFEPVNGARRWIPFPFFKLQPAEFAKIVLILAVAAVLAPERGEEWEQLPWKRIGRTLALLAVPAGLIAIQPDLGTMLALPFVLVVMLFAAGAGWRQLATLVTGGVVATVTAFRLGLIQDYQLDRVRVLLDPNIDPLGIGWNLRQSKLAIGSGQFLGKGLFQGTQTNFDFVPEQSTDFIFTAVGEQLGFVGGLLVLAAFLVVIWRMLVIANHARDRYGALVAVGMAGLMAFHVFVNIGMTVGIAPVTGLPLPFLSLGGSFYLAVAMGIGIVNSIWLRRSPVPGEPG